MNLYKKESRPMKLSMMLFPFHPILSNVRMPPGEFLRAMWTVGIRAFEPTLDWIDANPAQWRELRSAAAADGMAFSCLDIGVNLVGESGAERQRALDMVERGVEFCREQMQCPLVLLYGSKAAEKINEFKSRQLYSQTLARAVERVRGSSVQIAIEDFGMNPTFTATGAHCLEVLERAGPAVKFVFDNGNFLLGDDRPSRAYALLQSHIVHVHVKDFMRLRRSDPRALSSASGKLYRACPLGEGAGEIRECLALLRRDSYKDWVSLELGCFGDLMQESARAARTIKTIWTAARTKIAGQKEHIHEQ